MSFLIPKHILSDRNASIDVYRGIAILAVVLFHYDGLLKIGFIGVDLFFVISGYLVSRGLLKEINQGKRVNLKQFFFKRITKIIPSYYFFIIFGTVIARLLFLDNFSTQIIDFASFPKYLLFYMNYAPTFHWSFELSWSLCVEEHFYLFLGLVFIIIGLQSAIKQRNRTLKIVLFTFIILSVLFKIIGAGYGWDTYGMSHMRMDALFLGVLLSFQQINENKITHNEPKTAAVGIGVLLLVIILFYTTEIPFFNEALLHTLVPISFYLIMRGTLFSSFKYFKWLRICAYYSYNWYLWHAIIAFTFVNLLDLNYFGGLILYLLLSFIIAVVTTKTIEEPIVNMRNRILKKNRTS